MYQATLRSAEDKVANCEDMICTANGSNDPSHVDEKLMSICIDSSNFGEVHFTASEGQLYFVYVDFFERGESD